MEGLTPALTPSSAHPRILKGIAGLPVAPAGKRRPSIRRGLSGVARVSRPRAGLGSWRLRP
eukprot:5722861-Alexandrium_andersonii.AAC.1